jgi:hypothetical protein
MLARLNLFAFALVSFAGALADPAAAQLPAAAGQQIALSNPAWKLFVPSNYVQRPGAVADLLVHFHGDPQTYWNNVKHANLNAIVVTINYSGLSSAYSTPFSDAANPALFQSVLNEALTKARALPSIPDNLIWDQLAVTSFSAGYGAVRELLKNRNYSGQIDAIVAADSLYATTASDGTALDSQMAGYKAFASLAQSGAKTFIYSHSQVPTYTYESTAECGDELLEHLGLAPTAINQPGLGTLTFNRRAISGNFELWGATGADAAAHTKHLQYIGEFLEKLPLARVPSQSADFTKQGTVDAADLALWQTAYGANALADANGDGVSDGADFLAWQRQFGAGSTAAINAVAVPEPTALSLILALIAWPLRRRVR